MFVAIVSMNDTFLISNKVLLISKTQITQEYREYTRGDHALNHTDYIDLSNHWLNMKNDNVK